MSLLTRWDGIICFNVKNLRNIDLSCKKPSGPSNMSPVEIGFVNTYAIPLCNSSFELKICRNFLADFIRIDLYFTKNTTRKIITQLNVENKKTSLI